MKLDKQEREKEYEFSKVQVAKVGNWTKEENKKKWKNIPSVIPLTHS